MRCDKARKTYNKEMRAREGSKGVWEGTDSIDMRERHR